ncbi:Atxe2 family lasso peptide isopeptidase [Novosphingobium malaysiense]|nr:Atxe2 family lasso peptide isopeptidase [Novosphingobium malaysiense]
MGLLATRRRAVLALGVLIGGAGAGAGPVHAACETVLPAGSARPHKVEQKRLVTPEDLAGLRDIGQPDAVSIPPVSPLAVSPDGKRLAFVIARPVPGTNSWCRALVVMDIRPGARPRIVDRGGTYMGQSYPSRGLMVNSGYPEPVVPHWSPDGRAIAYRKRIGGHTQAWIAAADGSGSHAVGGLADDVETLAWSEDGKRLLASTRPGLARESRQIAGEAGSGYLYDDRFAPNDAPRPALAGPQPLAFLSADLQSGRVGPAMPADARRLAPDLEPGVAAALVAAGPQGRLAWLEPETKALASPMRLHARSPRGKPVTCGAQACQGSIPSLLWLGKSIVFTRREGWASERMSLLRWTPGEVAPRRIVSGERLIHGCVASGPRHAGLVCLVEDAVTPPRIEAIDPASGRRQVLFDPNPQFAAIRMGSVRHLHYRNAFGLKVRADLVLPPGYTGGRIPLVVVQYHSRGFLRGGTGDEYPIQAFAARGMAVLSLERPRSVGIADPNAVTAQQVNAANERDWADKRSLLSAIDTGVKEAVRLGIADPRRIGITGLSDGATTTAFALVNSDMFAAAAISSCCLEPHSTMIYGGPRWAETLRDMGYPPLAKPDPDFWKAMSLAANADRLHVPLLMQLADREYLLALESWAALKAHGDPVEMYVFPDEYHIKWQPAHRLAIYRRNLDWFDFWLAGRRDPDPSKHDQYRRWDAMKTQP